MTFQIGDTVEIELCIHNSHKKKGDTDFTRAPPVYRDGVIVQVFANSAMVEFRTPIGMEQRKFPLSKIRRKV